MQQSKLCGMAITKDTSPSHIIKDVMRIMSEEETEDSGRRTSKGNEEEMNCYEIEIQCTKEIVVEGNEVVCL